MDSVKMNYKWKRGEDLLEEMKILSEGDDSSITDLLKKDFIGRKVEQLAPNYVPPNPKIIMDLRSEMVQKRPWFLDFKRRIVKLKNTARERTNSNRELSNLRQHLNNRNIRNSFIMKVAKRDYSKSLSVQFDKRISKCTEMIVDTDRNVEKTDSLSGLITVIARTEIIMSVPSVKQNQFQKPVASSDSYTVHLPQISVPNHEQIQNSQKSIKVNGVQKEEDDVCRDVYLAKKYVEFWRAYVKEQLEEKRRRKLELFFEELTKKKNKYNCKSLPSENLKANKSSKDYINYHHRYKVQQNIIALQKLKLEEQNKLIEQLKYNKIAENSQLSVDVLKEEFQTTCKDFDSRHQPRIKCFGNELNIPQNEEIEHNFALQSLKVPHFLKKMEQRARERAEKHAIIQERKKQMEEEKIRRKQQAEIERLSMNKEEQIRRIEELRKKRRQERLEAIRRKQYEDRMRALTVMASLHYERKILNRFGFEPMKNLVVMKKEYDVVSTFHYNLTLKNSVFKRWLIYCKSVTAKRNALAEQHLRRVTLRKAFNVFKSQHREFVSKMQVAEDYYDFKLTCQTFERIKKFRAKQIEKYRLKCMEADKYYKNTLLVKVLTNWRTLPALEALQREQEARKSRWRKRVLCVIPDYSPARGGDLDDH